MRSRPVGKGTRRGLTLMEVLVVVAIIGILASILVPVLSRVYSAAQAAGCASNLRQMGVALTSYTADRGHYPLAFDRRLSGYRGWQARLFPDMVQEIKEARGVFSCPSASLPESFRKARIGSYDQYGYNELGLGERCCDDPFGLGGHSPPLKYRPPVKTGEVVKPVEMLALGPGFGAWKGQMEDGVSAMARGPLGTTRQPQHVGAQQRLMERHEGKANVVFCDGHLETIPMETLAFGTGDKALRMWNRDNKPHRDRLNR